MDYILKNGKVVDPETNTQKFADIAIHRGKITHISELPIDGTGHQEINAEGLTVVPGFIDIHMHEDAPENGLINPETLEAMLQMGVTTAIGGNCGFASDGIADYFQKLESLGAPVNLMMFLGYNSLREQVGLFNVYEQASKKQIKKMRPLVKKALKEGAIGLSFGLEYTPGVEADEIVSLLERTAGYDNVLASAHYRYDADQSLKAIDEMITISDQSKVPMQISHIGSCAAFGMMDEALVKLRNAREKGINVLADCYPYDAFSTYIGSAVFDPGCLEKWGVGYDALQVAEGKYRGKRCTKEIFEDLRKNYPDTYIICFVMNEEEVYKALKHPLVMAASDGLLRSGQGHPRVSGTFPRVLGRYVREQKVLTFEEALYKMTLFPAKRLGLQNKGRLQVGADADIVVLNENKLIDKATFDEPANTPEGIEYVLVNGGLALSKGTISSETYGKPLSAR